MALKCPVCNSGSIFERQTASIDLWRCPSCDHCFSDIDSIGEFEEYSPEYLENTHQNWFKNPNVALFEIINQFIRQNNTSASLVDVGCGNGAFLKYIHNKNPEMFLTGIDLAKNQDINGIHFMQGDILTADFHGKFDYVVSLAVIEHIADVRMFMKRLCVLCVPRGFLIIMTLNDRSILYRVARLLHSLGVKTPHERLYSKHHLNHFNPSSLKRLVGVNNLSVIKLLRHNVPLAAVDLPESSPIANATMLAGVWGTFLLGRLTGQTYLQTVICQKADE